MPRYGPADVTVTYNAQVLPDVTVIGDISKEAILEEVTAFSESWETQGDVGVSRFGEIVLEAPFNDSANQLSDEGDTVGLGGSAVLVLLFGGTKQLTITTLLRSITRSLARGSLTKSRLTLQPSGAPTEA